MLVQIDQNGDIREISLLPHQSEYDHWRSALTDPQYDAIIAAIANSVGDNEVSVSSFIPGTDWSNTPFWPIYESACHRDQDAARKFFGLLMWEYMMSREDHWSFGRYEIRGMAVEGLVYFRVDC